MEIMVALGEQHAELDALLADLPEASWGTPVPRCPGWTVKDVVLHMAQTDELAGASARGELSGGLDRIHGAADVDDGAALAVEREPDAPASDVLARWRAA